MFSLQLFCCSLIKRESLGVYMIEIPSKNKQLKTILSVYQRELLEESEMNAGADGKA